MKGEKLKRNTIVTSSSTQVMSAFLHKKVSSESSSSDAKGSNYEFSVLPPLPSADGHSTELIKGCQQRGTLANFVTKSGEDRRYMKKRESEKNVLDDIEELKKERKRMKLDIDSLVQSADDLGVKA